MSHLVAVSMPERFTLVYFYVEAMGGVGLRLFGVINKVQ
jgi:hypothetical protein